MRTTPTFTLLSLTLLVSLAACSPDDGQPLLGPSAERFADAGSQWSEWSPPVHLDAPVNSPFRELGGVLSRDELTLYFGSDRPGGQGEFDIWVSHRACRECPWEEPANLGPDINSAKGDGGPTLSRDGRLLIFSGARAGGQGGEDIWVSRRRDDDLGWETPANLGPNVNTSTNEQGPSLFYRGVEGGGADLLFFRVGAGFYQARLTRDGEVLDPAVPVAELNDLTAADPGEAPPDDNDEFFFQATRPGGLGGSDIWVATRRNAQDAWSAPHNLGPLINTPSADLTPSHSRDGRILLFAAGAAARPSLGFQDLWMTTRTPSGN